MAGQTQHIFLIPGFFGFSHLGGLVYFAHVAEYLEQVCQSFGIEAKIHRVATLPTASIRRRSALLLETIATSEAGRDGPIHLLGHSTGGLDARLLVTPHVSLPSEVDVEPIAKRVETVVTVSTPHHGTPLSSFFITVFGKQLLKVLSLSTIYVLRFGHLPLSVLLEMGALLTKLDNVLGWKYTVADQIFSELLADFTADRRREVEQLLSQTSVDQSLIAQLTPEGADVFNASTSDRAGVRYGSVVSFVPRPGLRTAWRLGANPYAHMTHVLFNLLYQASRGSANDPTPPLTDEQRDRVKLWLDRDPSGKDTDGIVPAWSQAWGEVIFAAIADHLDVVGHFCDEEHDPPHYDWLASGSRFDRSRFELLWGEVARYLAHR